MVVEPQQRYIQLTLRIDPADEDEGGFVAYWPELDISTQGEDLDEVMRNATEAVTEFLTTLHETGDLFPYLKDHNVVLHDNEPDASTLTEVPLSKLNRTELVSVMVATVGPSIAFV